MASKRKHKEEEFSEMTLHLKHKKEEEEFN